MQCLATVLGFVGATRLKARLRDARWLSLAVSMASCGGPHEGTDSNSNWFEPCELDEQCPSGASCVCQVCTRACASEQDCAGLGSTASGSEPNGSELICAQPQGCDSSAFGTTSVCLRADDPSDTSRSDSGVNLGASDATPADDSATDQDDTAASDTAASDMGDPADDTGADDASGTGSPAPSSGASNDGAVTSGAPDDGVDDPGTDPADDPESTPTDNASDDTGSDSTETDLGPIAMTASDGLCTGSNWCWQNPTPQGHWIFDLWTAPGGDLWAAVDHSSVLRLSAGEWQRYAIDPSRQVQLTGIWGSSDEDVWAVAVDGPIFHYQDGAWQSFTAPANAGLQAIWGASANDIWAVGYTGNVMHFDGEQWLAATIPETVTEKLSDVWGTAANDVWIVGTSERILHFDGTSWTSMRGGSVQQRHLESVWGNSAGDVWAVGGNSSMDSPVALHWDGVMWTDTQVTGTRGLRTIGGGPNGELWASANTDLIDSSSLYRVEGGTLIEQMTDVPGALVASATTLDGELWLAGETGSLLRYDGQAWSSVGGTTVFNSFIAGAWLASPTEGWAVGWKIPRESVLLHWDGSDWERQSLAATRVENLLAIDGTAANDVWLTGTDQVHHYDGTAWTQIDPTPLVGTLSAIWASAVNDVWVAGVDEFDVGVSHYDGTSWEPTAAGPMTSVDHLWVPTPGDVWLLGSSPFRLLAAAWSQVSTTNDFGDGRDMWGASADDAWLVGDNGAIHHWNGTAFEAVSSPTTNGLNRIRGRSASDIYAVGKIGTVLHYDGESWSVEDSGTTLDLNDLTFIDDQRVQVFAWGTAVLEKQTL